ncbi:MAG TPA: trigger factor [Actinocrinis sp.]|nr:trigger factor [Actinocrinis sp.]
MVKSTVQQLDSTRVRLTIEVPFEELVAQGPAERLTRLREFACDFAGGGIGRESPPPAFVTAVSSKMHAALSEHGLVPLRHPEVEVTGFGDGVPLSASAVVELRPNVELPPLSSVEIEMSAWSAGSVEHLAEELLERMRREFVDLTPVLRAARDGDFVRLDLRAQVDGGASAWEPADGVEVEVGSGDNLDGLNAALVGLEAGGQATITTRIPGGPDEGRQARVTVTVREVLQAREPDLDDAFAAAASPHPSLERLREAVRSRLDRDRRADLLVAARDAALEAVIAAAGLDPEQELSRHIVLDTLADQERIQVNVDELRTVIAYEMGRSGVSARTYRKHLARDGVAVGLYEHARREKALIHLLRHVVIKDADGNPVFFDDLALDEAPC